MKNMTLTQIADACKGELYGAPESSGREAAGVVIDSRLVEKDYLFIATKGERVDGHDYIDSALEKGALAVICEKLPEILKGPCILVESSFQALKDIAKWYRMQLNLNVVGITGSVGKTSTKEFISSVLSQKYSVLKTDGNFNNEVGLPLTILRIKEEHEVAVLEMGISDFGEMHRLSEIAKPDIAVITNIGECHLENLGSRLGVLKAKTEIFDYMNENGRVVINGNDDMLTTIGEVKGNKPLKFGLQGASLNCGSSSAVESMEGITGNDIYATNVTSRGLFGSTCDIHLKGEIIYAEIPLPGEHMILNALAAASVGTLLNLSAEEITAGIASVKPVGGRSNIIQKDTITILDDCYNANPVSMRSAINLLCTANTAKAAILGDMFELGKNEDALHYEVGAYAASRNLDLLVCVGKLSSHMYDGAAGVLEAKKERMEHLSDLTQDSGSYCTSLTRLLYFETREELIHALPNIIKENSTILVKASHGMGFDQIIKALS